MKHWILTAAAVLALAPSAFAQYKTETVESYEDGDAVFSTTPQAPMPSPWEALEIAEPGILRQQTPELNPRSMLTPEFLHYFTLLIVVNKAPYGTTAQTMKIYSVASGQTELLYDFKISTGREDSGQWTPTPTGLFTLDPDRFIPWPSAESNPDMKWAMYWDYEYTSRKSGFALHAAPPGTEPKLGTRASHGCIRMRYQDAEFLHKYIKGNYAGLVPHFSFDSVIGKTNREGRMVLNAQGAPDLRWGYQVLLMIVNEAD